jgi:2,3-dihydroxybiphenyl 1,2-dioxygenase
MASKKSSVTSVVEGRSDREQAGRDRGVDKVGVTELGYLAFDVRDLGAWKAFATEILGMEFVEEPKGARLRMDYWHQRIVLHQGSEDDLHHAGFRVSGPDTFWAMQRQLTDLGIAFEVASSAEAEARCVLELLKLQDPAGVPLEIFHGPQVDRHAPLHPGRGMHGRFVVGAEGLGHMIIRERGVAASERFYREALGMSGGIEGRFDFNGKQMEPVFMHCNPREHTVAFGVAAFNKRIQHFMVEVDELDDVGLAYDLARAKKVPILLEIGRHQNDGMVSFYMQTPSGFFCEYGWDGRPVLAQSEYNPRGSSWGHQLNAEVLK